MRIVILRGSPRTNGNSATLIDYFLKGLTKKKPQHIDDFFINELNISPCQGCLYCASSKNHECKINDDMDQIYATYRKADLIIYATPMYWGYMSAQLKTVMDRMEALAWEHFFEKRLVIIITYRHHFESTVSFFERIAPFFRLKLDFLTCCTYDKQTGEDIPISRIESKLNEAYQLGLRIGTEIKI